MCRHDACSTVSLIVIISSITRAVFAVRIVAVIGLFHRNPLRCIKTEDMFSLIWQFHLVNHDTHNQNNVIASMGILIQALQLKIYTTDILY